MTKSCSPLLPCPFGYLIASVNFILITTVVNTHLNRVAGQDIVVDFEMAPVGKHLKIWSDDRIIVEPAHQPTKSKAPAQITFFSHIGTGRVGVVNAVANESIPIKITFREPAKDLKLVLWGSTTSAAKVVAFDSHGKSVDQKEFDHVPVRKSPNEQVPFFEMKFAAEEIQSLEISGSKPGGFLVVDQLQWTKTTTP